MMGKWLYLLEKILLVAFTVAVVVYILLVFNFWADDWRQFFLGSGNIEWFIYVSLFLFVLTYILRRLLKWEIRSALGRRR